MGDGGGGYLVFVGRMAPDKAPDLAIATARAAGLPLRLAGIVEDRHRAFFEAKVLAACSSDVEYMGPLGRDDLWRLLGGAHALVMPLRWHEPFGLVAVESLATGTPVIGWRMGALPEIIEDGVSGFLVGDVAEAVGSVELVGGSGPRHLLERGRDTIQRLRDGRRILGGISASCGYDICASTCSTGTVATLIP